MCRKYKETKCKNEGLLDSYRVFLYMDRNEVLGLVIVRYRENIFDSNTNFSTMVLNEIFRTYLKKILYPSVRHPVFLKC